VSSLKLPVARFLLANTDDPERAARLVDEHPELAGRVTLKVSFPPAWVLAKQRESVDIARFAVRNCDDPATLHLIAAKYAKRKAIRDALDANPAWYSTTDPAAVETAGLPEPPPMASFLDSYGPAAAVSSKTPPITSPLLRAALDDPAASDDDKLAALLVSIDRQRPLIALEVLGRRRSYLSDEIVGAVFDRLLDLIQQQAVVVTGENSQDLFLPSYLLALPLDDERFARALALYQAYELGYDLGTYHSDRSLSFASTRTQLRYALAASLPVFRFSSLPTKLFSDELLSGYDDPLFDELLDRLSTVAVGGLISGDYTRDGKPVLPERRHLSWLLTIDTLQQPPPQSHFSVRYHAIATITRYGVPTSYKLMLAEEIPGALPAAFEATDLGPQIYERLVASCPDPELLADQLNHSLGRSLLEVEKVLGALYRASHAAMQHEPSTDTPVIITPAVDVPATEAP